MSTSYPINEKWTDVLHNLGQTLVVTWEDWSLEDKMQFLQYLNYSCGFEVEHLAEEDIARDDCICLYYGDMMTTTGSQDFFEDSGATIFAVLTDGYTGYLPEEDHTGYTLGQREVTEMRYESCTLDHYDTVTREELEQLIEAMDEAEFEER